MVGWSIPEASLLTSTSASPFTGARMKCGWLILVWSGGGDEGGEEEGCRVSRRIESSSRLAFLKT